MFFGLLVNLFKRLFAAERTAPSPRADKVESRIGTLEFEDGMPSADTLTKVYDNADFTHAYEAFVNTMQGVNAAAIRRGFADIGVKDNEVVLFSELMDAKSLFLTANADTVYFVGFIDLTKGPMVFESPPGALGTFDDMWRPGSERSRVLSNRSYKQSYSLFKHRLVAAHQN